MLLLLTIYVSILIIVELVALSAAMVTVSENTYFKDQELREVTTVMKWAAFWPVLILILILKWCIWKPMKLLPITLMELWRHR